MILKSIRKLKNGKAQGKDGIGAEFYKSSSYIILPFLNAIFNKILDTGNFPKVWSQIMIIPLYKSGSKSEPTNYRGISLLNVMFKIFSGILYNRLDKWVNDFQLIDDSQSGFRKGYSAIDNIFCLQSMITKYISKQGVRFYVLFVDFQKAFDSINHYNLFASLQQKGLCGKVLQLLKSMYSNMNAQVKVDSCHLTESFKCNIRTVQGDLLSPLIFSLYINDLCTALQTKCKRGVFVSSNVPEIYCLLFADDVANCADTVNNLQTQLNIISDYCRETGMKVNMSKTQIIVFRNGGPLRTSERWTLHNTYVNVTSSYKYMGLF